MLPKVSCSSWNLLFEVGRDRWDLMFCCLLHFGFFFAAESSEDVLHSLYFLRGEIST